MASLGQENLPQAQSVFNSPFSIKNILNLSEETQDERPENSNEKSRLMFPIVPRAMRPPFVFNMEAGLPPYSTTAQWLFGTQIMRFLPGK